MEVSEWVSEEKMYLIEKLLVLMSILKMFPNSCPELIKSFFHKPNIYVFLKF